MSVLYSNINPLAEIARQVFYLDRRIAAETGVQALEVLKAHRRGLIHAATWCLMAHEEAKTGGAVPLPSDQGVEAALDALRKGKSL